MSSPKSDKGMLPQLKGCSEHIKALKESIAKAAKRDDLSVLILGETGTGKEVIASSFASLHNEGMSNKYLAINCAAISERLFESELFGYVKGAFTDARKDKRGLIEEVGNGILFLDEIGDLAEHNQAKILRLLQEGTYMPVGATKEKKSEAKLIAATNKSEGLRADLRHRLEKHVIWTEPLRDHPEDVIWFANNNEKTDEMRTLKPRAKFILYAYDFPGNVRELLNVLEEADDLELLRKRLYRSWRERHEAEWPETTASSLNTKPSMKQFRVLHHIYAQRKGDYDSQGYNEEYWAYAKRSQFYQILLVFDDPKYQEWIPKIVEAYEIDCLRRNVPSLADATIMKIVHGRREKLKADVNWTINGFPITPPMKATDRPRKRLTNIWEFYIKNAVIIDGIEYESPFDDEFGRNGITIPDWKKDGQNG